MESLLKQLQRSEKENETGRVIDQGISRRRTGPRKSVSFDDGDNYKRTKKRDEERSTRTHYSSDGEYEAAIAAAAFAINSLSNEGLLISKKRPKESTGMERTSTRGKSYREEEANKSKQTSDAGKITRWLSSGKEGKDDGGEIKAEQEKMGRGQSRGQKKGGGEKGMGDARTIKWVPTFSDKRLNIEEASSRKGGGGGGGGGEKNKPATTTPGSFLEGGSSSNPSLSSLSSRKGNQTIPKPNSTADSWERSKMEKLRKRYDEMMARISEWETENKTKAKRKYERRERKIEVRRATSLQEYKENVARIDKIAGSARALASDRRRNDESKLREKARQRRLTGKGYYSCFGF